MPKVEYTIVCGVDYKHLEQLQQTFRTWKLHKPSLLKQPMLVFFDREDTTYKMVRSAIPHPNLEAQPWPLNGVSYEPKPEEERFGNAQRYKMLAGFVYVPAFHVKTPYWLKLDTDVIAAKTDNWIEESWFDDRPAIVAHRWSFTRPADQMLQLDKWVEDNPSMLRVLAAKPPLDLHPATPEASRVGHKRIISWLGFFRTDFTKQAAKWASVTCGEGLLPAISQDGYMWYCAARAGEGIVRADMKGDRGWHQYGASDERLRNAVREALT